MDLKLKPERGQQRYCLHHFIGKCVICGYNPWKGERHDRTDGAKRQRDIVCAERKEADASSDEAGDAGAEGTALGR